jgi:hypothetical protein
MERYCSTGQSPQRAVAPTEEEEEEEEEGGGGGGGGKEEEEEEEEEGGGGGGKEEEEEEEEEHDTLPIQSSTCELKWAVCGRSVDRQSMSRKFGFSRLSSGSLRSPRSDSKSPSSRLCGI